MEVMLYIVPITVLVLFGWVAYYISKRIFAVMMKRHVKNAKLWQILIGVILFLAFTFLAFYIIAINLTFER